MNEKQEAEALQYAAKVLDGDRVNAYGFVPGENANQGYQHAIKKLRWLSRNPTYRTIAEQSGGVSND